MFSFAQLKPEYERLFATMVVRPECAATVDRIRGVEDHHHGAAALVDVDDSTARGNAGSDLSLEDHRLGQSLGALGSTDALTGDVGTWASIIVTTYFGGRTIEKVARIVKR